MNKTELIDHIASKADISKAAAGRSLDALIGAVKSTLKKGRHCNPGRFRNVRRVLPCSTYRSQSPHR